MRTSLTALSLAAIVCTHLALGVLSACSKSGSKPDGQGGDFTEDAARYTTTGAVERGGYLVRRRDKPLAVHRRPRELAANERSCERLVATPMERRRDIDELKVGADANR